MATKTKKDYNDPLSIWQEMAAFDKKDYNFYDRLDEEQKKKFSPYLMLRWGSTVEGTIELASYYTVASNEFANINFWDLSKHKKLQWLVCCTVSPKIGKQRHYWLGAAKRESSNQFKNLLLELLPNIKSSDVDLILKTNTSEEILEWLKQNGKSEKELKQLS